MTTQEIINENRHRRAVIDTPYDPLAPDGRPEEERLHDDFAYWCARCVIIKDKISARDVPFRLNRPQRRLAAELERQRLAGHPLRLIMLKARQWGGSTLVQMYMAWIQIMHRRNWHSLICAQVKDTSRIILGMYEHMLDRYPEELWTEKVRPECKAWGRTSNIRVIAGRDCRVTVTSAENQDALRGGDYAMAHLTETAFWNATPTRRPEDVIRGVCGTIPLQPYTLIAIESTANGVGNYFHREWLRCCKGEGDKTPFFVPWHEIDIYQMPCPDPEAFIASWNAYERELFEAHGATLEAVMWYRAKRKECSSDEEMQAEFPTTPEEAFANSGCSVFERLQVEAMRQNCVLAPHIQRTGDCVYEQWAPPAIGVPSTAATDDDGRHDTWQGLEHASARPRYVVGVDIGGRTSRADWSVIVVIDSQAQPPEVVAQWRGHCYQDQLMQKCLSIAKAYDNALLVVESNSLEGRQDTEGAGLYVLQGIARSYRNVYRRQHYDRVRGITTSQVGFQTNVRTKTMLIDHLCRLVRESGWVERSHDALNELLTYQQLPTGAYAAAPGCHDDMLMARAMALWAVHNS